MKYTHFKTVALMLSATVLLALSGCDGTEGNTSEHNLAEVSVVTPAQVPDATTSTVTANPVSVVADGTATSIVTVTVNDANSNPITNATVTLAQTGTSTISAVTNVGDGTYTFNVNSTTVETVTYTATAGSVVIAQTADVTFTAPLLTEAECLFDAGAYEAIAVNGRTWLDRNLGASKVATDVNDSDSFGDLYQWGRAAEGHEARDSATTQGVHADTIIPDTNITWDGMFITEGQNGSNFDWTEGSVDQDGSERSALWNSPSSDANLNQVCPCGYVVPTYNDFNDLNNTALSEAENKIEIAKLKLPYSGERDINGTVSGENYLGRYWSSTASGDQNATYVIVVSDGVYVEPSRPRMNGYAVRCIKPLP